MTFFKAKNTGISITIKSTYSFVFYIRRTANTVAERPYG